jgi:hypothetical protein
MSVVVTVAGVYAADTPVLGQLPQGRDRIMSRAMRFHGRLTVVAELST